MVVQLQEHNFDKLVLSGDGLWFVKFYAPWCGHCKKLEPIWEKLAEEADKENLGIKYAAVDCTTSAKICTKYDVKGYPHLLLFDSATGRTKKFNSTRTQSEIHKFASAGFTKEDDATKKEAKKGGGSSSWYASKPEVKPEKPVSPPRSKEGTVKTVKKPLPGFEKQDAEERARAEEMEKEKIDSRFFWLNFGPKTHYWGPTRHVQNLYFFGISMILLIYIGLRIFSGGPKKIQQEKDDEAKKND